MPPNPGAWLTQTAKHRAIDTLRRGATLQDKYAQIARLIASEGAAAPDSAAESGEDEIGDDVLALMFTCCHPALGMEARVALTLRMVGGLKTPEIARAFLVPDSTVGQRISRAKRTLADAGARFEVPAGDALAPRLASVLEVVYLIFNEATPPPPATTGCGLRCRRRRCAWGACWRGWRRTSRRCTGSSR